MTEPARCKACGERYRDEDDPLAYMGSDERAEVYDPAHPEAGSMQCHASCIPEGWEVA